MVNLLVVIVIVWWFAHRWRVYERWTFFLFLWLAVIADRSLSHRITALSRSDEPPIADWRAYYYENHRDIFLLLSLIFPIDIIDTLLKGVAHFHDQGPAYFITMGLWFTLCLVAAFTKRERYHAFFAVIFMIYNLGLLGASLITEQGFSVPDLIQSR